MTLHLTPSAQYSITLRLEYPHQPCWISKITSVIGARGASIQALDLVDIRNECSIRDYTIECASTAHAEEVINAVGQIEGVTVRSVSDDTFLMHLGGKLEVRSKVPLKNRADLSMAYTPGVARVCSAIEDDPRLAFNLTIRKNCVAVVTDGSAVLGLGNIGPAAALPVMEGKAVLFKEFGGVDAFPICLDTQDPEEIVECCRWLAPTFGGINLEDISAPRCFEIEDALSDALDIPVFHDDQHGTAVVVLAGLMNALKITGRDSSDLKVVVAGAGAAGVACTRILLEYGVGDIIVCDSRGAIHPNRDLRDNKAKQWLASNTNSSRSEGKLAEVIRGADMFLGVSAPGLLTRNDVKEMAPRPIVFAMSNPVPEVMPEDVLDLVSVMATGRSDYPNQINNVLAFPGIFRGALDSRAHTINDAMKRAAAEAIAGSISDKDISPEYIVPSVFDSRVAKSVAAAVTKAAHRTHVGHRLPKFAGVRNGSMAGHRSFARHLSMV